MLNARISLHHKRINGLHKFTVRIHNYYSARQCRPKYVSRENREDSVNVQAKDLEAENRLVATAKYVQICISKFAAIFLVKGCGKRKI